MFTAVIMAGGTGTRLFPASTNDRPKQLVRWPAELSRALGWEDEDSTLLQQTYRRLSSLIDKQHLFVATTADLAPAIRRELSEIRAENVIVEPLRKNSAGACALATARVRASMGPGATVALIPADAVILQDNRYRRALETAAEVAAEQRGIVVIGLRPHRPATGYGYIRPGSPVGEQAFAVSQFIEKPNEPLARELLRDGCLWNSGIYVWNVEIAREAFEEWLPKHAELFEPGLTEEKIARIFEEIPSVSVDFGLTEKYHRTFCVVGDFGWDDVGSWDAFARILPPDEQANVRLGEVQTVDSERCIALADRGKLLLLGVSDLVVVQFGDAVLVCPRSRVQDVGKLAG